MKSDEDAILTVGDLYALGLTWIFVYNDPRQTVTDEFWFAVTSHASEILIKYTPHKKLTHVNIDARSIIFQGIVRPPYGPRPLRANDWKKNK